MQHEMFHSSIIVDLQLIKKRPILRNAQLLILTNDQVKHNRGYDQSVREKIIEC